MDFHWKIVDASYVIRNVPYEQYDGEILLDIDVAIKMAMLRDLMLENEIPHDVNYDLVADFEY